MRSPTHILALALILGTSAPAVAGETAETQAAKAKVDASLQGWESSVKKQGETRVRYEALEQRINVLKKESTKSTFTGSGELDRLLKQSVGADDALRAEDRAVESSVSIVKARVQEAIAIVDQTITAHKSELRSGSAESKKKAAHEIRELMDLRRELKQAASRVEAPTSVPHEWSRYEVKVEPLDGPSELQEKADFVEDQLDKFKKKREELSRLIQDAREEQNLVKQSAEFRTDIRHFDEEARIGRVTRQLDKSGGSQILSAGAQDRTPAAAAGNPKTENPPAQSAPPPGQTPSTTGGNPGGAFGGPAPSGTPSGGSGGSTDSNHTAPPPPSSPSNQTTGGRNADDGLATNPTVPAQTANASDKATPNATNQLGAPSGSQVKPFEQGSIAKPMDPNVLLKLRVDSLDPGTIDLKTLEKYATDLDQLERFLAGRAKELRKKAADMKASGKK